ncbi:putative RING/U-box superfamily protein [Hibiscus syriacus]|uniref:RING/U-box superfamily protein n=1 Tax=Hibiscus syriacus TaxID=106335 RepID=A0A6A2YVB2_HIBSY|nr:uncharacterized protein LOC120156056 [Hibiscus syriacus]KAE8683287.1 putative RING/U-box superfamily protein [Hibiscus syriacus]
MKSLSSVGVGLSIVFVVLFLALIAELYYLLWWKKRLTTNSVDIENDYNSSATELFYMFCWKKSAPSPHGIQRQPSHHINHSLQSNKDLFFKPYGDDDDGLGPPGLLFTIVEETKEDLESEEGVVFCVETPYLTPLASPPFLTPPLTPLEAACGAFDPLFKSSNGGDLDTSSSSSSPPSKFRFLQEAEGKLHRKKKIVH